MQLTFRLHLFISCYCTQPDTYPYSLAVLHRLYVSVVDARSTVTSSEPHLSVRAALRLSVPARLRAKDPPFGCLRVAAAALCL